MTPFDRLTLDRLVTGRHDPDDHDAWEDLATRPGGAEAWSEAIARRGALDRHLSLVRGRPWLASTLLNIRRLGRRIRATGVALTAEVSAPPLAAVLGPDASAGKRVEIVWGETRTLTLAVGETVRFAAATGVLAWRSASSAGELDEGGWRLEAGEAPVLILAIEGPGAGSVEARLATAVRVGGVVLVEREFGESTR